MSQISCTLLHRDKPVPVEVCVCMCTGICVHVYRCVCVHVYRCMCVTAIEGGKIINREKVEKK